MTHKILTVLWILSLLSGCAVGKSECLQDDSKPLAVEEHINTSNTLMEIELLVENLKKASGENIIEFIVRDFDANRTLEAFAFTGELNTPSSFYEDVTAWFITKNQVQKLFDESNQFSPFEVLSFGEKYGIKTEIAGGSASSSVLFIVNDGHAVELPEIQKIQGFKQIGNDLYTGIRSGFSQPAIIGGHEFLTYWFYWKDGLYEYGGIPISEKEFLLFDGAEEIITYINDSNGEITDIFYRENGIININYGVAEPFLEKDEKSRHVITVRYDEHRVYVEPKLCGNKFNKDLPNAGTYYPAAIPEIASYPKEFLFPIEHYT